MTEPASASEPTTEEIERLLAEVPIFRMLSPDDVDAWPLGTRPLLLGPTQRFVIEGREGTSLFLVGEGEVEVRLRNERRHRLAGRDDGPRRGGRRDGAPHRRAAQPRPSGPWSETVVFEIGREQYEPLLLAHPEWLEELATIMEQRLTRRGARLAERSADVRPQPLLERIRRNFFG